jgi:pimeloyl-ACP methyl ester carboxylesterase
MSNAYEIRTLVGSGPLLVYISGLDGTGELFFKQVSALARTYRVVAFRSRDHGRFTYDDLADDVAAIIKSLGERRATIVGESFGGTVALNFALRYPEMVERLVVVNSFPRFRQPVIIKLAVCIASWPILFGLSWPLRRAANLLGLLADGVKRQDRRLFFKAIRTVKRQGYARRLQLIADLDIEDRLSEILVPVLFIAGEKDLLVRSAQQAHAMRERVPNSSVKIIKGAGHALLMTDRVSLAEILADESLLVNGSLSR